MRTYFAYIRVSTVKQGEKGSSLTEQKDAILAYAQKHGLHVSEFFEEQVTAAKLGRAVFRRMLTRLKKGNAHGLIMHKVDRGARNLADWAEIASLRESDIDVHFAHEAIDMGSRGGRLSADIQAVVAADFIRNLKDEVRKGQNGRLKQGLYPFGRLSGYQNNGKAALKTIDPVQGPLVRETFEQYATGRYSLHTLRPHMTDKGLLNSAGRPFNITGLSKLLNTSFYYGMISVKGRSYVGKHAPIITKALFDRVRAQADGRVFPRGRRGSEKEFALRRLVGCSVCGKSLYAEQQKAYVYYRCHSLECRGTSLRETDLIGELGNQLLHLPDAPLLIEMLGAMFDATEQDRSLEAQGVAEGLRLQLTTVANRETRLTDLLIDGALDQSAYEERKTALHKERFDLLGRLESMSDSSVLERRRNNFLELLNRLKNIAVLEIPDEIRQMAKMAISNLSVSQKTITVQWSKSIEVLLDLGGVSNCAASLNQPRTGSRKFTDCDNGALNGKASQECRYSVIGCDFPLTQCAKCVTDRDELFRKRVFEHSGEIYAAVISDERLDQCVEYNLQPDTK